MTLAHSATTTSGTATRTIELALRKFPSVPPKLIDPATKEAVSAISFPLKDLLHHHFLAVYGDDAQDKGVYEIEPQLTDGPDWRFLNGGIGADSESKRNKSNELGKGFARWFLHEHVGITYFCPLENLLNRNNSDGSCWTRTSKGDLPDYVCGPNKHQVSLLEAKGRYRAVGFKTKAFQEFRAQIQRATLLDKNRNPISVKGFISVAQWATEKQPRLNAQLSVEDPKTKGREVGPDDQLIGLTMVAGHYSAILRALNLSRHAETLRRGGRLPNTLGISRGIWECVDGPLKGRRFVGGVLPEPGAFLAWPFSLDWPFPPMPDRELRRFPFYLAPPPRLFGVEEAVFHQVLDVVRHGVSEKSSIEPVDVPPTPSSLSLLRDGTVLGPAHYFAPRKSLRL